VSAPSTVSISIPPSSLAVATPANDTSPTPMPVAVNPNPEPAPTPTPTPSPTPSDDSGSSTSSSLDAAQITAIVLSSAIVFAVITTLVIRARQNRAKRQDEQLQ